MMASYSNQNLAIFMVYISLARKKMNTICYRSGICPASIQSNSESFKLI